MIQKVDGERVERWQWSKDLMHRYLGQVHYEKADKVFNPATRAAE